MKGHLTFASVAQQATSNGAALAAVAEPIHDEFATPVEQPRHLRVAEVPSWRHTLVLTGRLDQSTAGELADEIDCLCQEGVTTVMLDLSRLDGIDLAGVQVIATGRTLCTERGRSLGVVSDSVDIRRVFVEAGVDGLLASQAANGSNTNGSRSGMATSTVKAF